MAARAFCTCDTAKFKLQSEDALSPASRLPALWPPSLPSCAPAHSPIHAQRGASMVEYALLVALIALIAIPSVGVLGGNVTESFYKLKDEVAGAGGLTGEC